MENPLLVADAIATGDGGNKGLADGELDFIAIFVEEFDLVGGGGFAPRALNDVAVLENVGGASAISGDIFVIVIGGEAFFDDHGNDYRGGDLGEATNLLGVGLAEIFVGTFVNFVRQARGITTEISIGVGVIIVNDAIIQGAIKGEVDVNNFGGGGGSVARAGLGNHERISGGIPETGNGGFLGRETAETFNIGSFARGSLS